jgi:hypothetical protein
MLRIRGVCGTPSPELIEQLKDSPVQVYTPFSISLGYGRIYLGVARSRLQFIQADAAPRGSRP